VVVFPIIGLIINLFWGRRLGEKGAGWVASVAALLSFAMSLALAGYLVSNNFQAAIVNPPLIGEWIHIASANVNIPWQMRVDTLSVTMLLVVTGVGSIIHIYAIGYMHGDERFARFFAYLNLFLAFMLILVLGNNFLMMFVGWEGVGLSSFLLIGFWFDKAKGEGLKNSNAAKKAFIVNRVGDFGVLMSIFLMFWTFSTLDFFKPGEVVNTHLAEVSHGEEAAAEEAEAATPEDESHDAEAAAAEGEHGEVVALTSNDHLELSEMGVFGQAERMLEDNQDVTFGPITLSLKTTITLITLFMLLGVTGKSAQIPLFVWLPDAMAGPTPVSALIHAATMVTAGVYIMTRSNVLFVEASFTSFLVAIIGAGTAIMAGYIAIAQWDIKRVLAYSTISQLGFMVAAVGVGAYSAAMFHLVTHAFFKALLFLGSGSVIHGMEHGHHHVHEDEHGADHDDDFDPQDMRFMGGLITKMPLTYLAYIIGTLALAGIFPLAGFWSKDEILADAFTHGSDGHADGWIVLVLLLLAAGFTAFYMWRQVEMVFHGKPRSEAAAHASESPVIMTGPLMALAFLSIVGGFLNTPSILGLDQIFGLHRMTTWLEQSVVNAHAGEFQPLIAIIALGLALGAIAVARSVYGGEKAVTEDGSDPLAKGATAGLWQMAHTRLHWDEFYDAIAVRPYNATAYFLANIVDWEFLHDYIHNAIIGRGFKGLGDVLSKPVDLGIIDGVVNGVGSVIRRLADWMRQSQSGYVRLYAISFLLGVVLVLIILLIPMINQ